MDSWLKVRLRWWFLRRSTVTLYAGPGFITLPVRKVGRSWFLHFPRFVVLGSGLADDTWLELKPSWKKPARIALGPDGGMYWNFLYGDDRLRLFEDL